MPSLSLALKPRLKQVGSDVSASIVVFLVALPLCLGVAMASDAPLFSGLLAGIVGGIVVGTISGSHTSVAGPAAGLVAVVATQIASLGSFEAFLLAVLIAGALQVALGVIRAGSIADFIPSSVIKGLLAAIGLILILKQIPHLFGHDSDPPGEMSYHQPDGSSTFSELTQIVSDLHWGAALVGIMSLGFLLLWNASARLRSSPVPAPLLVVLLAVAAGFVFEAINAGERWQIGPTHLVDVPVAHSLAGMRHLLRCPDLSQFTNPAVYSAGVILALVASLETLLNLEAVDKLDVYRRVSPPNRELIAQGIGNMTAGLIGALPVTSVIVRSSVNVSSGGKTKLATVLHGTLLLISITFFATWLNLIPLSALAGILIATGIKLASPKLFRQMWDRGLDMFLPFVTTIVMILMTDLLVGVSIGLAINIGFILWSNQKRPLRRVLEKRVGGEVLRIELANQVSFLSRLAISRALDEVPQQGHVMIDATRTDYIDPDVLALIMEYRDETAPARHIKVSTAGLKHHYEYHEDRVEFVDLSSRELQARMTPEQVLDILKAGNHRFVTGRPLIRDVPVARSHTKDGQHPLAVVFSGTSSRTPIEAIFDVGLGDISCVRSTAHWADEAALGSLEYAALRDCVKLIVVMGHSRNEAIEEALNRGQGSRSAQPVYAQYMERILRDVLGTASTDCIERWKSASVEEKQRCLDDVALAHVRTTIRHILQASNALRRRAEDGQLRIAGCMYNVETGVAQFDALK
ncbi:MAG: bifunctional SulP family inorganic anion transporter/carbonic anhydrase [Myxococcales bacterium]|nr:bifunctional SulP family inorganic anion transporter/carbonic anhydrase [Myxococcales bacterium]